MREPSINHMLQKFWKVEEPVINAALFTSDQKCENYFCRTTIRDFTGRITVLLPFHLDLSLLGNFRDIALSRFYNLERKLLKYPIAYGQYRSFMKEYESLGHMKIASCPGKYHIPHHAIVKHDGGQIKLHVVFDVFASSLSGKLLNDLLHIGPKLQTDISYLLHCYRLQKYMVYC